MEAVRVDKRWSRVERGRRWRRAPIFFLMVRVQVPPERERERESFIRNYGP